MADRDIVERLRRAAYADSSALLPDGALTCGDVREAADLIERLRSPAEGAVAGWKMVPVEATEEQIDAAQKAANDLQAKMEAAAAPYQPPEMPADLTRIVVCYRAMLAVAPPPPAREAVKLETTHEDIEPWDFSAFQQKEKQSLAMTVNVDFYLALRRDFDRLMEAAGVGAPDQRSASATRKDAGTAASASVWNAAVEQAAEVADALSKVSRVSVTKGTDWTEETGNAALINSHARTIAEHIRALKRPDAPPTASEERAKIVAWLRDMAIYGVDADQFSHDWWISRISTSNATAIEAGEHEGGEK